LQNQEARKVPNNWHQAYTELTKFVAEHPEVEIGTSVIKIPEKVRPEFYRLFDAVRAAVVEEKFPGLLAEAVSLSQNYLKAEEEVTRLLALDGVTQPKPLYWFLKDPLNGLTQELFDFLFELLEGKTDAQRFEALSSDRLAAALRLFEGAGYEKWVALSLIGLLGADKLFRVNMRPVDRSERTVIIGTMAEERVPPPQESTCLSFDHSKEPLFAVPDFIVHSARTGGYVAFRSQVIGGIATASNPSQKREWCSFDSISTFKSLSLVYVDDNPEDISLVMDARKICRPDLIIESRGEPHWFELEGLDGVKSHHDSLRPRLGTFVVSRGPVAGGELAGIVEGIQLVVAGLDASSLLPVVSALAGENEGRVA
jgi:hypothetical protein